MRLVTVQDDHWLWDGKLNSFGTPIGYRPGTYEAKAAIEIAASVTGKTRILGGNRTCDQQLCVNPSHWQPRDPKTKEPKPRAQRTPRAKDPNRPAGSRGRKIRCQRGHLLSETRRTTSGGNTYCQACRTEKAVERYAALSEEQKEEARRKKREREARLRVAPRSRPHNQPFDDPKAEAARQAHNARTRKRYWEDVIGGRRRGTRFKDACKYGHNLAEWRRRYPSGAAYCYKCRLDRQAIKFPLAEPKTHCQRGHDYATWGKVSTSGRYCARCKHISQLDRLARRRKLKDLNLEGSPLPRKKETCKRGHNLAETRHISPKGSMSCKLCARMRSTANSRRVREAWKETKRQSS